MTLIKHVLITGASGRIGSIVLETFDADKDFTVSVLTRYSSGHKLPLTSQSTALAVIT